MIPFYRTLGFKISVSLLAVILLAMSAVAARLAVSESEAAAQMTIDKGRLAALAGAKAYGVILEAGVKSGQLTLDSLLDPKYVEIKYNVPVEHRRYHTGFDAYTDTHGIQALQDSILENDPDIVYASGIDHFGYVPTPHARYNYEPTGDKESDAARSRQKRKYEDPVILTAARFQGNENQKTLVQEYWRKPGGLTWDIAAPITVEGHHFGVFRVGVRADQIESRKWALVQQISFWFGIFAAVVSIAVFVMLRLAMRPLNRLAVIARALGEWDGGEETEFIKNPVPRETRDEIGGIASCLDRIRRSLRTAKNMIENRSGVTTQQTRA